MKIRETTFNRGFTLIEVLIVVVIIGLVVGFFMAFQKDFFTLNNSFRESLSSQAAAQNAIRMMVKDIRTAGSSDNGGYPILDARKNSLAFFANIDNDSSREQVRYFIQADSLKRGIVEASGTPPLYDIANEVILSLVDNIVATDTALFTYYDKFYAGTTSPLTLPVSVSDIRLVKIQFSIDRDPNASPAPISVTSQVFIRNLKDN